MQQCIPEHFFRVLLPSLTQVPAVPRLYRCFTQMLRLTRLCPATGRTRCCGGFGLVITMGGFNMGATSLLQLKSIVSMMGHFLSHHGGWGLFLISYLDSSFLAFPFINDLLLIKLSSLHPASAFLYALECTTGSVLGAYTLYFLSCEGSRYFSRKALPHEKSRLRRWYERNDFLALLLASLLPPPMPFKIFPIIAGGLRTTGLRFITALVIGRGIRFAVESWLGIRYGAAAEIYLRDNIVSMSVVMIAVILAITLIYRWLRRQSVLSV